MAVGQSAQSQSAREQAVGFTAAQPRAVLNRNAKLESRVVTAFGWALSMPEHIKLANAEAGRPGSCFEKRLAKSDDDLKAETRRRYEQVCP